MLSNLSSYISVTTPQRLFLFDASRGALHIPGWQLFRAELILKDGSVYTFDNFGRLLEYTDPSGKNKKEYFLLAGGGSIKINPLMLVLDILTGGIASAILGTAPFTLSGNVQTEWVFPLETMEGPVYLAGS